MKIILRPLVLKCLKTHSLYITVTYEFNAAQLIEELTFLNFYFKWLWCGVTITIKVSITKGSN